ncbi:unnamed protein product [Lathyrus sativus]|nr:unnamed protein product [Lathyrus sativus]
MSNGGYLTDELSRKHDLYQRMRLAKKNHLSLTQSAALHAPPNTSVETQRQKLETEHVPDLDLSDNELSQQQDLSQRMRRAKENHWSLTQSAALRAPPNTSVETQRQKYETEGVPGLDLSDNEFSRQQDLSQRMRRAKKNHSNLTQRQMYETQRQMYETEPDPNLDVFDLEPSQVVQQIRLHELQNQFSAICALQNPVSAPQPSRPPKPEFQNFLPPPLGAQPLRVQPSPLRAPPNSLSAPPQHEYQNLSPPHVHYTSQSERSLVANQGTVRGNNNGNLQYYNQFIYVQLLHHTCK